VAASTILKIPCTTPIDDMSPKYTKLKFIVAVFMLRIFYEGQEYSYANSNFLLGSPERWKESSINACVQLSTFLWFIQSRDCGGGILQNTVSEDVTKASQTLDVAKDLGNFSTSVPPNAPSLADKGFPDEFQQTEEKCIKLLNTVFSTSQVLIVPFLVLWFLLRVRSIYFIGFLYHILNSISMVVNADMPVKHKPSFGNKTTPDKLLGGGQEQKMMLDCGDVVAYIINGCQCNFILNGSDENGYTALMLSAKHGLKEITSVLCSRTNANMQTKDGVTALMEACSYNQLEVVQVLLASGCDINHTTNKQMNALMLATVKGHTDVVRYLLDHNASLHTSDQLGNTALMLAVQHGHLQIIQLLLEKGAAVCAQNSQGHTPLMIASKQNFVEAAAILLMFDPERQLEIQQHNGRQL